MLSYEECGRLMASARGDSKPLEGNTRLSKDGSDGFVISLHGNAIVRVYPDRIEGSHRGFVTKTTADRLKKYLPATNIRIEHGKMLFACGSVFLDTPQGPLYFRSPVLHGFPSEGWVTFTGEKVSGAEPIDPRGVTGIYQRTLEEFSDYCRIFVRKLKHAPRPAEPLTPVEWLNLLVSMVPTERAMAEVYPHGVSKKRAAEMVKTLNIALSSGAPEAADAVGLQYGNAVVAYLTKIRQDLLPAFYEHLRKELRKLQNEKVRNF